MSGPPGSDPSAGVVGVVGVGRMGEAVCARLAACGIPVCGFDLLADRRAATEAAGARWCGSLAELTAAAGTVLTLLPGPAEVRGVAAPLVDRLSPGGMWIDLTSSTPDVARELAALAASAERELGFIDAPVGGNPDTARRGELLVFAGGSAPAVRAARAVLDHLAHEVLAMGPIGAGCTTKLLVNLIWLEQAIAGAEVLTLGGRLGLEDATLLDAVHRSAAASRFMDDDARRLLRGENMTSFSLARCRDELREVLELAGPVDVTMPLAQRTLELYDAAVGRYGEIDGELLGARMIMDRNRPPAGGGRPAG
jgi:3-hydroxyisobutyrate dehydrogenase